MAVDFNPSTIISAPVAPCEQGEGIDCGICLSSFKKIDEQSDVPFLEAIFSNREEDVEEIAYRAFGHYSQMADGSRGEPHLFCERCFIQNNAHNPTCALCRQVLADSDRLLPPTAMTQEERGQAVRNAALNGHLAIVTALLANGNISDENRGTAVRYAAEGGHLAIVTALLANGNISVWNRGTAVRYAAEGGHLAIVTALLANGNISDEHRGWAVTNAAGGGHLAIVTALLANCNISDEDRGRAVSFAAAGGHLDIVRALLASGNISNQDRLVAFRGSIQGGHFATAASILQDSFFRTARFLAVAPFLNLRAV